MTSAYGLSRRLAMLWVVVILAALAFASVAQAADPLGARYNADGTAITFRVYSSKATRVEVWVYASPQGQDAKASYSLSLDKDSHVWSVAVRVDQLRQKGLDGPVFYGYRAWGPNWTYKTEWKKGSAAGFIADVGADGDRFNPNKLLLDPYAPEVSHDYVTPDQKDGRIYESGSRRAEDTGAVAPKGVVLKVDQSQFGEKPKRGLKDEIIYEVHLRGLTGNDPSVPNGLRGTYAGAARKAADLKALGITAVEFLPVFEFQNDTNGSEPNSAAHDNYWGYDPDSFFAPDRRYAADKGWGGPTQEFKAMVKAFHDQGLKVYLDVVYNHTGEGDVDKETGQTGRIQSWRGLDNATYYEVRDDNAPYEARSRPTQWRRGAYYANNNGVGPNVNAANLVTRDLVVDSMKHWSSDMGVDGFRCDLAAVLGNTQDRGDFTFDKIPGDNVLNRAVKELPGRQDDGTGIDLIAEPYAIGGGTFQLGNFPTGWAEWNDRFRYPFRRSQNKLEIAGQEVAPAELARHFAGSSDLFQANGRKPYHGVNYIVAHDGFTLRDLYTYQDKRNNQPFPLGPSPGGSDNNISWDSGGDPALQRQAARNGLALILLSAGVPMIVGGDEMYRTEYGNNNPFNLDNNKFYLEYANAKTFSPFLTYAKAIIAFRRAHPVLRRSEFYDGQDHNGNGLKDITFLRDDGREADAAYLDNTANHFIAFRLDATEAKGESVQSVYVAYNGWKEGIQATLPSNLPKGHWKAVADTSGKFEDKGNVFDPPQAVDDMKYKVAARSVAVLIEEP
jgi:isoamylase